MNILGMWFPLVPTIWAVFAGLVIGYLFGRSSGLRDGFERAKKQVEQQQANQAYLAYLSKMMGEQR
jgi:hypothetical protein